MNRQKFIDIIVILGLSILALVFAIEFGLRRFYNLIPIEVCAADVLIGTYTCRPNFVYDNPIQIGYKYKPGLRLEGLWDPANPYLVGAGDITAPTPRDDSFWFVFETDEMGFPNSQYEWQSQYDIVVTGDSFTVRTSPQTWIEILAEQSDSSILTLGAQSWGTLNQEKAIQLFGLDKQPKWVILLYFEGNDLLNVQQYLERKESGLDWRAYDYQGTSFFRRLLTPHLLRFFGNRMMADDEQPGKTYIYPMKASTEVGEIDVVFKDIHLLPISADYETLANSDEFEAVQQALLNIDQMVRNQNGRFLVVYVPSKEHVLWSRIWDPQDVNNILARTSTVTLSEGTSGRLQFEPQYLSFAEFNENHRAQEQLLSDFTTENNIEFLNLTPIFWNESIENGEFYHFADVHWNQAGNQLAADAIWQYMQKE